MSRTSRASSTRRHAGAQAAARHRGPAPGFADQGQPPDRLAQHGLRRRVAVPPRHRPPDAAAHRHGALDPRAGRPAVAPSRGPDQGPHQHGQGMTDMHSAAAAGLRRLSPLPLASPAACGASPDPVLYTIAIRPGPTLPGRPQDRAAARHRSGELSRPSGDRALVRGLQARRHGQRLVGRAAGRACWRACWWSSCRSACPTARSTARAAPSRPTPMPCVGVNIQRLDADKAGTLMLLAQAAVEFNRPRRSAARNFTISKPLPTPRHRGPGGGDQRCRGRTRRRDRGPAAAARSLRADPPAATDAEPPVTRPQLRECLGLRPVPDRAGARRPTCARTACAAAPRCAAPAPIRWTATWRSLPPRWCCSPCCGSPC